MSSNNIYRAFGWVQNPSNFSYLKATVRIFDPQSRHYANLRDRTIQEVITEVPAIREALQRKLNNGEAVFTYQDLVGRPIDKNGKTTGVRQQQVANGLIQITVKSQKSNTEGKQYTDTWTADGFLRWAVSLGFVHHDRAADLFSLTEEGANFSNTADGSEEEQAILTQAVLRYPPACRVLQILNDAKKPVTKFYIGQQLGFEENGFTSYDEKGMITTLAQASKADKNKIRSDYEGTSDKYARMIAGWLAKLGLVEKISSTKTGSGFAEYQITIEGKHRYGQSIGSSKNSALEKFVMWEFFATRIENTNYVRSRRANTLKILEHTKSKNILKQSLCDRGFDDSDSVLERDLVGLNRMGIRIDTRTKGNAEEILLRDRLNDFSIPELALNEAQQDSLVEKEKDELRELTGIAEKYINMLSIARDKAQSRTLEEYTAEVFENLYGLHTEWLGGGRKPDVIAYSVDDDYGLIIDTKAYSKGYSKNISQADEMLRYVVDNQKRSSQRNKTVWWNAFDASITHFYYLWVSSDFVGQFPDQLRYMKTESPIQGGAITIRELLLGAAGIQRGLLTIRDIPNFMNNSIVEFNLESRLKSK